jgi:hypothetical protein
VTHTTQSLSIPVVPVNVVAALVFLCINSFAQEVPPTGKPVIWSQVDLRGYTYELSTAMVSALAALQTPVLENLALRKQLAILQRNSKRPRLRRTGRAA